MSKKTILAVAVATLAFGQLAKAQTNIQVFYDFGKDRKHVTTTVEGFYNDNWGNTFFFVDHDFNNRIDGKLFSPNGTYMEIARCLNFWQNTPLAGLSAQIEYNGGIYNRYAINNAVLAGLDYFFHSKDFKNTLNVKVLYKWIDYRDTPGLKSKVPMQFTLVWGLQDLFGAKGLRFSGFADFWWQDHMLYTDAKGEALANPELSHVVFLTEPQLWYNVGQWFGVPNFNVGGEVELSYDFGSAKGFWVRPCLGVKWVF
ncbi:MAG: DUF5020 family protein [Bacteroidales bacterium]|nr:DUF5020 family protein [Bacteroidales bacterium]